ncbi:hypothetical protein J2T55_001885 [Methylohalomonas lacus]|uniref:CENP-V/GFA domain-containing protein n=1 Tax=Methylohalomonas lacus TaxID=398773 RepID=A0AAE3HNP4_9GAMM|nr:GFA family protein [Methylohalomonas lacus]MCS3903853.1 hypothetical protein [Methylohalomonas lacus]
MTENKGSCLCGAVSFVTAGRLRGVVNCHCGQCRQFHGHFAAYTAIHRDAVTIADPNDQLGWYDSSPGVRRGFCRQCGSSLFWDRQDSELLRIAAGCISAPTGLTTEGHIYMADAGDYYRLQDELPKRQQGLKSPLIE